MNKNKKLIIWLVLSFLLVGSSLYRSFSLVEPEVARENDLPRPNYPIPPWIHWTESYPIIIEPSENTFTSISWEKAVAYYPWCSGEGTEGSPYLIRNVLFDGLGWFSGLTIKNSNASFIVYFCLFVNGSRDLGPEHGLGLFNANNGAVRNSTFWQNDFGLRVSGAVNCSITGCFFSENFYGVYSYATYCEYIGNKFVDNGCGICAGGEYLTYSNNEIYGSNYGMDLWACSSVVSHNTVYNSSYGIFLSRHNNEVYENEVYDCQVSGIHLEFAENNLITRNTAYNNMFGVLSSTVSPNNGNNVTYNDVWGNSQAGISLLDVEDSLVANNTVRHNEHGVELRNARNILLFSNFVSQNDKNGIELRESSNKWNFIFNNTITNNFGRGVSFSSGYSLFNSVFNNTIAYNGGIGVYATGRENLIVNNTIAHNGKIGAYTSGEENKLFNNLFFENVINAMDNGSNTNWDYQQVGNFWDDYSGKDLNDNKVGDTPYLIIGTANGSDNYPRWQDEEYLEFFLFFSEGSFVYGRTPPSFEILVLGEHNSTWYSFDQVAKKTFFSNFTTTVDENCWDSISNGTHTLHVYANNSLGTSLHREAKFQKDVAPPQITIHTPLDMWYYGEEPPTLSFSLYEAHLKKVWYELNNATVEVPLGIFSVVVDANAWGLTTASTTLTLTVYAEDEFGNRGFSQVRFYVIVNVETNWEKEAVEVLLISAPFLFSLVGITLIVIRKKTNRSARTI